MNDLLRERVRRQLLEEKLLTHLDRDDMHNFNVWWKELEKLAKSFQPPVHLEKAQNIKPEYKVTVNGQKETRYRYASKSRKYPIGSKVKIAPYRFNRRYRIAQERDRITHPATVISNYFTFNRGFRNYHIRVQLPSGRKYSINV